MLATIARVRRRLLREFETRAAHLVRFVAPDFVVRALAAQTRRQHAEAFALACDEAHRRDPLRPFVAHNRFLVRGRVCGLHCSCSFVKLLKNFGSGGALNR